MDAKPELEIRTADVENRELFFFTKVKRDCVICSKETNQDLVYVYRKRKLPIVIPLLVINYVRWNRSLPAFYGYRCRNCEYIQPVSLNTNTQKALIDKYQEHGFVSKQDDVKVIVSVIDKRILQGIMESEAIEKRDRSLPFRLKNWKRGLDERLNKKKKDEEG